MAMRMAGGRRCAVALQLLLSCCAIATTEILCAQSWDTTASPAADYELSDIQSANDSLDGSYGELCGDSCRGESECFGGGYNWWLTADYLLWRIDGSRLPPLVTDSPLGTAPLVGSSTTRVVAGNGVVGNSWRSGYRLEVGGWLDDCHETALVGDYFHLGEDDYDFYYPGSSGRTTGRPYFNTELGVQSYYPISGIFSGPVTLDGTVSVVADDELQGAGLTLEQCVYRVGDPSGRGPSTRVTILGGYRYYGYNSRLYIGSTQTITAGTGAGSFESRTDQFNTNNEFHGGEIGAKVKFTQSQYWFDGVAKVAIGSHHRSVAIDGETVSMPSTTPMVVSPGGLFTSDETNIGNYTDGRARLIPEFRFGIGAHLTERWTVHAGYSVLIWGGVVRAAGVLPTNLAVDPRNIPPGTGNGGAAPWFPGIGGSELVAHGLDLGVQYAY